ncbi:MAG: Hsp20/alpha crystallin family protein [Verrucomicrobia bacterium]|nr:Hsp20/alpha crystallin family protein [Verrucomicrobiota bacterium]
MKVEITDEAVILDGERKFPCREVSLPEGVKTEKATANFKNGVLEVTVDAPQTNKNRRTIE